MRCSGLDSSCEGLAVKRSAKPLDVRAQLLAAGWACLILCAFPACSRRAPGPDECVAFAEMTFGAPFQSVVAHPSYKLAFDRLVTTCLTAPFERRVFVCTAESRAPLDCLRRFQPELFGDTDMVPLLPREPRLRGAPYEVF